MNFQVTAFLLTILLLLPRHSAGQADFTNEFTWSEYPGIPPPPGADLQLGLASPFAGKSGSVLIVAGGCNFPDIPVRDGGNKKYYDDAYVFAESGNGWQWKSGYKIPQATAYGASVSVPGGLLCIGGNGISDAYREVFLLSWDEEKSGLEVEDWPPLPFPMSQMGAAMIGHTVYVAGGLAHGKEANSFLALDLTEQGTEHFDWEVLEEFPGQARIQPVVVAQNSAEEKRLYLVSGKVVSLQPDSKVEHVLVSCSGMGGDKIGDQVLFLTRLPGILLK